MAFFNSGLNRGKWFQNNSISSAMAKLLCEQIHESSNPMAEKNFNIGNCKKAEANPRMYDVVNMAWCSGQQKRTVLEPSIQEQTCAAVKSFDSRPPLTIGKIQYRYQKDSAFKKKAKRYEKKIDLEKDLKTTTVDAPSPLSKWTEFKLPVTNLQQNERAQHPGMSCHF